MRKTKKLTLCAVFAAAAAAIVYISSVVPTGQLGFAAVASLFTAAAVIEGGSAAGFAVYVISSVIAFLLVPNKAPAFLYIIFFGYYPVLKVLAEKLKLKAFSWVIKLAVLNAALTCLIFILKMSFLDLSSAGLTAAVTYIAANIIFIVFDIGYTKLLKYYRFRISSKINK